MSRVSYLRTGVTSKADRLGLTQSGYPSGTNFGGTPRLARSQRTTLKSSHVLRDDRGLEVILEEGVGRV